MTRTERKPERSTRAGAAGVLALLFTLPALLVHVGERAAGDAAAAAGTSEARLFAAAEAGDLAAVERLLGRGARVNGIDDAGCTALYYATRAGHADVVRALIRGGADVNLGSPVYGQPLIRAAMNERLDVAAELLAAGADPDVRDACGNTAVWYATTTANPQMVALLRAAGAAGEGQEGGSTAARNLRVRR